VEERVESASRHALGGARPSRTAGVSAALRLEDVKSGQESRIVTRNDELDRVLGGGIVRGSAVLVAGDPGIGKSTLMTELGALLKNLKILYVTGEESPAQVKMRAERLGVDSDTFLLLAETDVEGIIQCVHDEQPDLLVVDSIQTVYRTDLNSAPGSVAQVRESAAALIQMAKATGTAAFIVGHVTKQGSIAGPRVLEHMVDTVLYLEGDRHHAFRILRAVKNRFGSTNEIGVFEMQSDGLSAVGNPSALFLSERSVHASGTAVVCSLEGTRPLLAEIQALVTDTSYSTPQRTATGFDPRRLQMLLAVLEKRVGLRLSGSDVFVNVTGGLKLSEPAVDLGMVAAIVSSFRNRAIPGTSVLIGEVGLGGEIRSVPQLDARVREATKLGFTDIYVPESARAKASASAARMTGVASLEVLVDTLF
jgi:DNA repair protein RadA/Sms